MIRRVVIALAVLTLFAAALYAVDAWRSLDEPMPLPEGGYVFEVAPGTSFAGVARALHEEGHLPRERPLRLYARGSGLASHIKAGEYLLKPPLTPRGLLDQLVAGRVLLHAVTIVEGWTFAQTLAALANNGALAQTLASVEPAALMERLGAGGRSPEGLFFPDTYRFARGTEDVAILAQAYEAMSTRLAKAWSERASGLPFDDPYEALVLASIVERETSVDSERGRIAGVFVKRLRLGMRLQTDPTVIYGLGAAFDGDLRTRDLQQDTAYNTYTRAGLPPTPIAMPGAGSLQAAVRPEEGDALYFVATGDGSHHFSATLAEHEQAVARYLRVLRGSAP